MTYLLGLDGLARRGARDDVGRWPGAARPTRPSGRRRCCCPGRRAACGRRRRSRSRAASPTRCRSTWAARAPTSASCAAASPSRRRRGSSPATRSGCPRSTSTRSAPVAARSPASTPAARSSSAPRARAPSPAPRATGAAATKPTVTDADLVLGRIPDEAAFPGLGRLDVDAARRALERAGVTADGVVAVVDAAMERAVRVVTVERGVDPRDLALVAFGGAGPLHACAVADALGMRSGDRPAARGRALGRRPRVLAASARARPIVARRRSSTRVSPPPSTVLAAEAVALVGGHDAEVETAGRLPLRGTEPRAHGRRTGRVPRRARAPQRLRPARRTGRGRGAPRARPPTRAAVARRPPAGRAVRSASAPRSWPSPTAPSGCPTAGGPSPAPSARGC